MLWVLKGPSFFTYNHRNSIGYEQTALEIKQQEREADLFAKKYLPFN